MSSIFRLFCIFLTWKAIVCTVTQILYSYEVFNPFPNDKILDLTELKAFADNKLNVTKLMSSLYDRVENTVGKGENADYQHFLLFSQYFLKPSSLRSFKVGIVW